MIKELVIHLGDTKTGSTSIQQVLARKAFEVEDRQLFYPTNKNHAPLALSFVNKRFAPSQAERFKRLHQAFVNSDADIGIISAEQFQFVDPAALAEAIDSYWPEFRERLRLVAYVRPHVGKYLSSFSERVKHGKDMSFDSLESYARKNVLRQGGLDYMPRFARWRDIFGERFILRPFVRDRLHEGDVVEDFFHVLVGDGGFRITERMESNRSLSMSQLALIHRMHRRMCSAFPVFAREPAYREARMNLGLVVSMLLQRNGPGLDGRRPALPASLADAFRERYRADAEALDATFFEGTPMSDALEQAAAGATTEDQPLKAEYYFSPDPIEAFDTLADLLAAMVAAEPKVMSEVYGQEEWRLQAAMGRKKARVARS